MDFLDQVDDYTPIVFTVCSGSAFILLMLVFRSIVVPDQGDPAMNLLSVAAAYGVVVATFQPEYGFGLAQDALPRLSAGRDHRGVAAVVPVLDPLRPLDGLPRVPAVADQ